MYNYISSERTKKTMGIQLLVSVLLFAAAVPVVAEEVTQQFNGLTLNANLELADGRTLEDGVVLILHGTMGHNRMEIIEASQRALLENGQNSLAINLSLGVDNRHGFFDCERPHRHLQDDAIEEIGTWVAWLRAQGADRIVMMAHSRGANQAMVYTATRADSTLTHLVMLAPGTSDPTEGTYVQRYGDVYDTTMSRVREQIEAGKGDQLLEDIDFFFCPKALVTADTFDSYYRKGNDFQRFDRYLPQLPIPTLVITGTLDERQPNIEEDLTPWIDGQRVKLIAIELASHFFLDFNIEEAVEAVVEFIGADQ